MSNDIEDACDTLRRATKTLVSMLARFKDRKEIGWGTVQEILAYTEALNKILTLKYKMDCKWVVP